MAESYLERAMRGVKPRYKRSGFFDEPMIQPNRPRHNGSGHADKQGVCRCGYDQTCMNLVCAECNRMVHHNQITDFVRDVEAMEEHNSDRIMYLHVGYLRCACGAKKWLYGCEARHVQRTN